MQDFSVAMSVYKSDNPLFFDRALESITDLQTIKPSEICLVVDGPVPNEINDVIEKYTKKYSIFNIIRLKNNGGLGNALRLSTESARFNLIARMDSDDISAPDRFDQQLKYFELNPDIDVVGGNINEFVGEESNVVATRIVPRDNNGIRKQMKTRCAMNHVSVMFKKNSIMAVGGYQNWFWNEDYFLWIRMWLDGAKFANTGTILVNVRTGSDMYARRGGLKYYKSEKKLQKYMLQNKMIGRWTFICNCLKRYIVQCLFPNSLRGWVFRHVARKQVK